MASLTASAICFPAVLPPVKTVCLPRKHIKCIGPAPSGLRPLCLRTQLYRRGAISLSRRRKFDSVICAGALNARCSGASQTQTVTRESSTITVAPVQGKDPKIDDQGPGLPPRDDDGGGGGGGGGGGWSGGFFFFGFLALLGFLRDNESEESPYERERDR